MEFKIIINKLNGHDTEGKIGKINKRKGDTVKTGDTIFSIESGKGSIKFASECDGVIQALTIDEGQTVKKGQEVGSIEGTKGASNDTKKAGYSFGLSKPKKEALDVDVVIVGGGPGGYVAAIRGAQLGLSVAIIEKERLGGTCLNKGCIPTKALASSVSVLNKIKHAEEYGMKVNDFEVSMELMMARKNNVVNTLVGGVEHLMSAYDVKVVSGEAIVVDESTLQVLTKKIDATITYKNLVIATGASPFMLPIEGNDLPEVLTSEGILNLTEIPDSLTIIGGGVIGMEFAFIFSELGSNVTVVEFAPEILALLDQDVVDVVKQAAEEKGIRIMAGFGASKILKDINGNMITEAKNGDVVEYISSSEVLMAVGRKANIKALDLDILGVQLNERENGIEINDKCQTNKSNIYAIGDVTNKIQLAHVASHQGLVAMENIAGNEATMEYNVVPSAIFTSPEIGNVGMTEKEATSKGIEIKIGKFPLMANGKALCMGESEGFVKIIADKKTDQVIGGVIIGIHATDMIATVTQLIKDKTKISDAQHTIYSHPTTAESIHEALLSSDGKAIHFA